MIGFFQLYFLIFRIVVKYTFNLPFSPFCSVQFTAINYTCVHGSAHHHPSPEHFSFSKTETELNNISHIISLAPANHHSTFCLLI